MALIKARFQKSSISSLFRVKRPCPYDVRLLIGICDADINNIMSVLLSDAMLFGLCL